MDIGILAVGFIFGFLGRSPYTQNISTNVHIPSIASHFLHRLMRGYSINLPCIVRHPPTITLTFRFRQQTIANRKQPKVKSIIINHITPAASFCPLYSSKLPATLLLSFFLVCIIFASHSSSSAAISEWNLCCCPRPR